MPLDSKHETVYNSVVEQIVNFVSNQYPDNLEARLRIYDRIAEGFSGMARVFRKEGKNEEPIQEEIDSEGS